MTATLYRPLSEDFPTFGDAKLTDIFSIISFDYTKRFYSVGEFTMEIPVDEPAVPFIERDTILITDTGDSLYVTDTKENERTFVIEGKDLKVLLSMRITLFPNEEQEKGTYGYYVVKGATEYCIKDIVQYNISNAAEEERRIYGFTVAGGGSKGIADDRYMTRLEALDYVAEKLCKNAGIGWDVTVDIDRNEYIFDVIEPMDRSEHQTDVSKVIFSKDFFNVKSYTHERGTSSLKNAIYAVNSGGGDPYVQIVYKDENTVSGVLRKETTASVSCDYDEIQDYARKSIEDKIETDNSTVDVFAADNYKKEWFLGDICTFVCGDQMHDYLITEVHVNISGDGYAVDITAGDKPPTAVGALSNTVYQNSRSIESKELLTGGVGKFTNKEKNSEIFNDYENNTAEGVYDHTAGQNNKTTGDYSSVCGGQRNENHGRSSVICGGVGNIIEKPSDYYNIDNSGIMSGTGNRIGQKCYTCGILTGGNNRIDSGSNLSGIVAGGNNGIADNSYQCIIGAGSSNHIESNCYCCEIGAGTSNVITKSSSCAITGADYCRISDSHECFVSGDNNTITNGYFCTVLGMYNNVTGDAGECFVFGVRNKVQKDDSIVFGHDNVIDKYTGAMLFGNHLTPYRNDQIIFGNYNAPTDGKTVFVVAYNRNILEMDESGNLYILGNVYPNGTKPSSVAAEKPAVKISAVPQTDEDIDISGRQTVIAEITAETDGNGVPVLYAMLQFSVTKAGTVDFNVMLDEQTLSTYSESCSEGEHFKNIVMPVELESGTYIIKICVRSDQAEGTVDRSRTHIMLSETKGE